MNRLLNTLIFCFLAVFAFAQTPQAICYQGGATNAEGTPLAAQNISIRSSIVSGNANGTVEWSETHTTSTDDFGLFTIDVGTGTPVGGTQSQFSDINWGSGDYFLRIEMDAAGGSNYEMMGTTQILSVPYALFAEGANVAIEAERAATAAVADSASSASVATVALALEGENDLSNTNELQTLTQNGDSLTLSGGNTIFLNVADADADSTNELQELTFDNGLIGLTGGNVIDTRDYAFGAPGASPDFPQGLVGEHLVLKGGNYQVPNGKTFFMTAGPSIVMMPGTGDPNTTHSHPTTPNMPVLKENTTVNNCYCTGILVDMIDEVEAVTIDFFQASGYTVPTDKILFVKSGLANDLPGYLIVDGVQMEFFRPNFTRGTRIISFPEFTVLKKPDFIDEMVLTGYLIDKNVGQ